MDERKERARERERGRKKKNAFLQEEFCDRTARKPGRQAGRSGFYSDWLLNEEVCLMVGRGKNEEEGGR